MQDNARFDLLAKDFHWWTEYIPPKEVSLVFCSGVLQDGETYHRFQFFETSEELVEEKAICLSSMREQFNRLDDLENTHV